MTNLEWLKTVLNELTVDDSVDDTVDYVPYYVRTRRQSVIDLFDNSFLLLFLLGLCKRALRSDASTNDISALFLLFGFIRQRIFTRHTDRTTATTTQYVQIADECAVTHINIRTASSTTMKTSTTVVLSVPGYNLSIS
jgi:hypothetical protein